MKKILFFGDSITDMGRTNLIRVRNYFPFDLGTGYPQLVSGDLGYHYPNEYEVINKGISGHRSIDLLNRIEQDVWVENPDYLTILVGTNDVWHTLEGEGISITDFEKNYRMMIESTIEKIPNVKIILVEPFILMGEKTKNIYDLMSQVRDYAKVVRKLSEEYQLPLVLTQDKLDKLSVLHSTKTYLYDGVHPSSAGSRFLANEWEQVFFSMENKK